MLVYCPVKVYFLYIPRPSLAMLMSRKSGVVFSNKSKVDIWIKIVKMFQNTGDCVAFDEMECAIYASTIEGY